MLLYILIAWKIQAISGYPFNLYHSDNDQDEYCLTYHPRKTSLIDYQFSINRMHVQEMKSYCLRPSDDKLPSTISGSQHTTNLNISFAELRQKNITSTMLLSWSASVDMAERYQIFRNNYSNLSSENAVVFHNCTPPWFGPFCQFTLTYPSNGSFTDVVSPILEYFYATENSIITCYIHLACRTSLACLDWREICDGKQDCVDGVDEQNCLELEMNECTDDEYRCGNGQCIPWEFYRDESKQFDCLDRTDELPSPSFSCYTNAAFECEEHTCRPGEKEFPCGDGYCVDTTYECDNGRDKSFPKNFCTNATLCSLELDDHVDDEWCAVFCPKGSCLQDYCSMAFDFQHFPLLFGRVRLTVSTATIYSDRTRLPDYVCYDHILCPHLPPPTAFVLNLTCHQFSDLGLRYSNYDELKELVQVIKNLFRRCSTGETRRSNCSSSTVYRCLNSTKCISKHRLLDGFVDCAFGDDETYEHSCALSDIRQRFKCRGKDNDRCFASLAMGNEREECTYGEDEYSSGPAFSYTHISFRTICDGAAHLLPLFINGQSETDETGCEPWQCNNTYTRCNVIWSCKDGADEIDCPDSICPTHHHSCVFPNDTSSMSCLPIDRAGDNIDDCIGATDEQKKTSIISSIDYEGRITYRFRCRNYTKIISNRDLCNKVADCPLNDDEVFCQHFENYPSTLCWNFESDQSDIENFLCNFNEEIWGNKVIYPQLRNVPSYPLQLPLNDTTILSSIPTKSFSMAEHVSRNQRFDFPQTCNRGVPITSLTDRSTSLCLCSPVYYGDRCQYQNQRVSLTLQIRLTSDWRHVFVFLITLIDTQTNIESHEHIEYIATRDCRTKFNLVLLYTTRPKNSSNTFSVRIDAFTQTTLNYRASWIFPLPFAFLPVHRMPVILTVPFSTTMLTQQQCFPPCIHGQCSPYINEQSSAFCRCEPRWSGVRCDIKVKCECAFDAVCVSESICLCPPGRFGPRCHLSHSVCHSQSCLNGGQCIPLDARYVDADEIVAICICPENYVGARCEYRQHQTQIGISFHHKLTIPPSLLVHLIAVHNNQAELPNRTSIAKKLQFDQSSLTLSTTSSFNIALAQMFDDYYLIILREKKIRTAHISTQIIPTHRCRSLAELFNHTFTTQHLIRRIKSYHLPCQQHRELMCFYDEGHICLCTLDRSANCLDFDHGMTYECQKAKYCGDGGECFQDDFKCATSSFCACHRCYFGSRCQFSTKGSTLSLDIILGYHIRTKTIINQQPSIVKSATALTSVILAFGLIDGLLSFQIFRGKEVRAVGCGLYLLTTSLLSIIIAVVLTLKFTFLLAAHIGSINSRWFLHIHCTSMDFLLRSLASANDWLNACVAIERAVNAIQGTKFDKTKSRRVARWMIVAVFVVTGCSYIHDAVYRRVMNDEEEQRSWCLAQYPPSVQVLDWTMNILHFSLPFAINAVSAVIIIIMITRSRSSVQKNKSYKKHLREQLRQHKHLLISPLILVALALPRLVISFLSGCMGSARQSWLYLIGYYISFIPSIMTLLVFILPSDLYKKELQQSMKQLFHR